MENPNVACLVIKLLIIIIIIYQSSPTYKLNCPNAHLYVTIVISLVTNFDIVTFGVSLILFFLVMIIYTYLLRTTITDLSVEVFMLDKTKSCSVLCRYISTVQFKWSNINLQGSVIFLVRPHQRKRIILFDISISLEMASLYSLINNVKTKHHHIYVVQLQGVYLIIS